MASNGHTFQPVVENTGESAIGVGIQDGMVVLRMAEPMDMLGMQPAQAAHIAMAIMRAAVQLDPELADGMEFPDADPPGGDASH